MASASNGFVFPPSPLYYEELYNWCCTEVDTDKIIVNLSHKFDRKPLEEDLENQIEKTWQEKMKQYPLLYNGNKFRLKNVSFENNNLVLNIGMTCYRDFICTNMRSDLRDRISSWSSRTFNDSHACFADPIGVNGLVISRDDEIVFLKRSLQLYECPGKFHTPGGHPEPSVSSRGIGMSRRPDFDQGGCSHIYLIDVSVNSKVSHSPSPWGSSQTLDF